MTGSTTQALAYAFAAELRKELGDEKVAEAVRRNAEPRYVASCASHDFCDANMVMAAAFEQVIGREFEVGSEADAELWNRAWDVARESGFSVPEAADASQEG